MPPGAIQEDGPPAASVCAGPADGAGRLETLRKRTDFLACARGRKAPAPGFVLQARRRAVADNGPDAELIRVGFTASKKVGNAVARNRAKRRLRALARAVIGAKGQPGWDYVLVARRGETGSRPFAEMEADLVRALKKVHAPRGSRCERRFVAALASWPRSQKSYIVISECSRPTPAGSAGGRNACTREDMMAFEFNGQSI